MTLLSWLTVGVLVVSISFRGNAEAQTSPSPRQEKALAAMAGPATLPLGALPGAGLSDDLSALEFDFEGTESDGVGTAALNLKRGSGQYRVRVSSPVRKATGEAVPLDLGDGLASGATFELTASNLRWTSPSDEDVQELINLCTAELSRPSCKIDELPAAARAEMRRLLHYDDTPMYLGASVLVSERAFDYLDASLAKQSDRRRDIIASARIGAFSETFGFGFFSVSYGEQSRPAAEPRELCQILEGTAAFACDTVILGSPVTSTTAVVSAELRHFFTPMFAIAPTVRHDWKSDVTSVSVPMYFLQNKQGGLTGGVRSTWRSDTESVSVVVFVGKAFTLTP